MFNIAIAACILLFAAAGYIAFMNSKLIADKNGKHTFLRLLRNIPFI